MEEKIINIYDKNNSQLRCPYCNSSQIEPDPQTGKLKCNYCQKEFEGIGNNIEINISNLKGKNVSVGASDINKFSDDIITVKCKNCGAEVVVDTNDLAKAKCHWCQSNLSVNSQVDNGTVPDMILPFKISKEEAYKLAKKYVRKKSLFANRKFKKDFTIDNLKGVYFPYFIVDSNQHVNASGIGKHITKKITENNGNKTTHLFDVDSYKIEREFDIAIDDLSIEANLSRIVKEYKNQTNNIINSIMPFDTENCVRFASNYLIGYNAEKRDIDTNDVDEMVMKYCNEIIMDFIKKDTQFYDYFVQLPQVKVEEIGSQWVTAYLPVWLYSYRDTDFVLHYVAVNARTGETNGSIPFNHKIVMIGFSIIVFLIFCVLVVLSAKSLDFSDTGIPILLFLFAIFSSIGTYKVLGKKYRNKKAKHSYADETKYEVTNLRRVDEYIEQEKGLK